MDMGKTIFGPDGAHVSFGGATHRPDGVYTELGGVTFGPHGRTMTGSCGTSFISGPGVRGGVVTRMGHTWQGPRGIYSLMGSVLQGPGGRTWTNVSESDVRGIIMSDS